MTGVTDGTDPGSRAARWAAVDRRVATMVVLGSVVLVLTVLHDQRASWSATALAWSAGGALLLVLLAAATVVVTSAPERVVRVLGTVLVALQVVLVATWPAARAVPDPGSDVTPWVWVLTPMSVGLAAVVWPSRAAVAFSPVPALALAVALWLADGTVSREVVARSCIQLGNVAFIAILVTARRQLALLWTAERQAEASAVALVRATAVEAEQARLSAVVHDEVLATLVAAMQRGGAPDAALAAQASRALAVLDAPATEAAPSAVPVRVLAARVRELVQALAPTAELVLEVGGPPLPAPVGAAVEAALGEALRNSVRHAGGGTAPVRRTVLLSADGRGLRAEVRDDGRGFDPGTVPTTRLGVAGSVLARLRALPGGSAEVRSAPGAGTRVLLVWERP
jgi:signal transduction histidine kinase